MRGSPAIDGRSMRTLAPYALDRADLQQYLAGRRDEAAGPASSLAEAVSDPELRLGAVLRRQVGKQRQGVGVGDKLLIDRRFHDVLHDPLSTSTIGPHG